VRQNEINNIISKACRVGSFLVIAGIVIATSTSGKTTVTAGTIKERSHFREYEERKGKEKKRKERRSDERVFVSSERSVPPIESPSLACGLVIRIKRILESSKSI
jgi:hypothetical protein